MTHTIEEAAEMLQISEEQLAVWRSLLPSRSSFEALQRELDYWKARAQRAEGETITAESECDSLRVTLAATRAELDGLLVRMANESRMTMRAPLQKWMMGKEPTTEDADYRSAEQGCS